ncbi:hypothetical protein ACFQ0T_12995 [Kitasatospora gansuensis]
MGLDGTYGQRAVELGKAPGVPPQRPVPFDLVAWAGEPRPELEPGVYRLNHRQSAVVDREAAAVPAAPLLLRAGLNLAVAWLAYLYGVQLIFWVAGLFGLLDGLNSTTAVIALLAVNIAVATGVIKLFGRMGRWPEVWRRWIGPLLARTVTQEEPPEGAAVPTGPADPWERLRQGGAPLAAQLLDRQPVTDVDYVRIQRAWETVLGEPDLLAAFTEQIAARGAAACAHPSEARDLAGRSHRHDLLTRQVRLGTAQDVLKNPPTHRATGFALDPALLGTSLLAVGPAGTGKTAGLARPLAEALCLQALAGTACAVVIGAAEADLGPDDWYDVVIAPGDLTSPYGLDLFGAAAEVDEAAARLADALLPDELSLRAESARAALQQTVGPFHAAYGRYPGVRELRELLGGEPENWATLRQALADAGELTAHQADLQHRERQHGRADDPGALLADRLALLDRPAFAGCFPGTPPASPPSRCGRWTTRSGSGSSCPSSATRRRPGCCPGWSPASSCRPRRAPGACAVRRSGGGRRLGGARRARGARAATDARGERRCRPAAAHPGRPAGEPAHRAVRRGRLPDGLPRHRALGRPAVLRGLGHPPDPGDRRHPRAGHLGRRVPPGRAAGPQGPLRDHRADRERHRPGRRAAPLVTVRPGARAAHRARGDLADHGDGGSDPAGAGGPARLSPAAVGHRLTTERMIRSGGLAEAYIMGAEALLARPQRRSLVEHPKVPCPPHLPPSSAAARST